MSLIGRYREWYEHERDSNEKMLTMLESVPEDRRSDPRFVRAIARAAHLAACRENWFNMMAGDGKPVVDWAPENESLDSLRPRFASLESTWTAWLGSLSDEELARDFVFQEGDGSRYRLGIELQIYQLLGHAHYHRGQVVQLVDELGGETVDTDYVEWALPRNRRYGRVDD